MTWESLELPLLTHRIGGSAVPSPSEARLDLIDPCTGNSYGAAPIASANTVDNAVNAARKALADPAWADIPPLAREALMHKLADALEADMDYLASLEAMDTGRPIGITKAVDVPGAVAWLRTYAGWPSKIFGSERKLASTPGEFHAFVRKEPVGVVAAVTPWNFPLILSMWKIAPALAAGCSVVLKPAPETPMSILRLADLAAEVGFPPGVINVVLGDGAVTGKLLVEHPGVAKVAFTGSTATGQRILAASVPSLKKVTLELGGKSPNIIFPDADLPAAIAQSAASCFFNSGQVCYAGTRLYVHKDLYEAVIMGLQEHAEQAAIGPSWNAECSMGPLISQAQYDKVTAMVERAEAAGIKSVPLTHKLPEHGFYFPPTVLRDVDGSSEIAREEIFGPVLSVIPFESEQEVVAMANDSEYGLAAHVWTKDLGIAHRMSKALEAGTVFVNCVLLADPAMPFGGYKKSGLGRENGPEALEAYLQTKSVVMALP